LRRIKTGDVVKKCLQNQEQCTKGDSSEEEEKRKRKKSDVERSLQVEEL
jgi:hypothetical protein